MKLRIKGNSIRLRLTQTEVKQLEEHNLLSSSVDFSELPFRYEIFADEQSSEVRASFREGCLRVSAPRELIRSWVNSDLVGFEGNQSEGAANIRLLIEKDFACLKPREGEDDSDAFPHPDEGSNATC